MLHTKFCENRPAGSGKEDFSRVLLYMGVVAFLVMCKHHVIKFSFPCTLKLEYKIGL